MVKVFLLLAIVLVGCSQTTPSAYPGEQGVPVQGSAAFPNPVPTPVGTNGTVVGQLIDATSGTGVGGVALYFGTLLPLTPGPDHLINVDPVNSPQARLYEGGKFLASNIPPGEYALVMWTPHDSRFVPAPDNPERELIVEVVAGKIVDIGTVTVTSLR